MPKSTIKSGGDQRPRPILLLKIDPDGDSLASRLGLVLVEHPFLELEDSGKV
jgi:hypothetical protein